MSSFKKVSPIRRRKSDRYHGKMCQPRRRGLLDTCFHTWGWGALTKGGKKDAPVVDRPRQARQRLHRKEEGVLCESRRSKRALSPARKTECWMDVNFFSSIPQHFAANQKRATDSTAAQRSCPAFDLDGRRILVLRGEVSGKFSGSDQWSTGGECADIIRSREAQFRQENFRHEKSMR